MASIKVQFEGYGFFEGQAQTGYLTHISGTTATFKLPVEQGPDGKTLWITRDYSLVTGKDVRAIDGGFRAFSGFRINWLTFPEAIRLKAEKRVLKAERRAKRKAQKKVGLSAKHTVQVKDEVDEIGTVTVVLSTGARFTFPNQKVARRELRAKGLTVRNFTKTIEGDKQIWTQ